MSDEFLPDSDDTTAPSAPAEQGLKVSVTFDRKASDGNYGSIEARAWVETEVPRGSLPEATVAALQEAFAAAKVVVLDELAIPYVMDDNGVIREKITPSLGQVVSPETRVEHAMGPATHGIKIMNADEASKEPLPPEVIEWATANGFTALYDNRLSAKGNQPRFKQAITKAQKDAGVKAKGWWPKD
jgi:hypothetical protein